MTEDNNLGLEFKYLIVNDMDRKFGLWVNTVGYQSILRFSLSAEGASVRLLFQCRKRKSIAGISIGLYYKGRGLFSSDSTPERQVCKGRLMVLFPGQWHTYYPLRQTGWTEYYIGFEGPVIDTIVGDAFLSQERQILEVGINEELVSLFSRALEVAEADKISAQQYLSGIVLHMIGMILSISKIRSSR